MYKNKVIKTLAMANYLLDKDCKLFRVDKDRNNENKVIFLFVENDYLKECMDNYDNK
jgi:hypothetical protein